MEAVLFDARTETQGDLAAKRISPSKGILKIESLCNAQNYSLRYLARQLTRVGGTEQLFQGVCLM